MNLGESLEMESGEWRVAKKPRNPCPVSLSANVLAPCGEIFLLGKEI